MKRVGASRIAQATLIVVAVVGMSVVGVTRQAAPERLLDPAQPVSFFVADGAGRFEIGAVTGAGIGIVALHG